MDFEVDHPTISLSLRDSIFPAGATVPVVGGGVTNADSDVHAAEKGETLGRLRVYIEATRRVELCLDEVSSAFAEEDFVKARQQGQPLTVGVECSIFEGDAQQGERANYIYSGAMRFALRAFLSFCMCADKKHAPMKSKHIIIV